MKRVKLLSSTIVMVMLFSLITLISGCGGVKPAANNQVNSGNPSDTNKTPSNTTAQNQPGSTSDPSVTASGTAVSSKPTPGAENPKERKVVVKIAGSPIAKILVEMMALDFKTKNKGIQIDIQTIGANKGIEQLKNGTVDFAMTTGFLTNEEKGNNLIESVLAFDAFAFIVHNDNDVSNLTMDQAKKIYLGEINNWSEVGGSGPSIMPYGPSDPNTIDVFSEIMKVKRGDLKKPSGADGDEGVIKVVNKKKFAMGYISFKNSSNDSVNALKINNVDPTVENIRRMKYPVIRPYILVTKGTLTSEAQKFLDYALNEGQKLIGDQHISAK